MPTPTVRQEGRMSVNVAKRRSRSQQRLESAMTSLPIGEVDQTIFACPVCARPLAIGTGRCPGCGTHLLARVQARLAALFISIGLVAGLLIGAGLTTIVNALGGAPHVAAVAPGHTASPSPNRTASPSPSSGGTAVPAVPPIGGSALVGAVAVDSRLAASRAALVAALGAPRFDVSAVAQTLRTLSADAVLGLKLTSHLDDWPAARAVGADLTSLYISVQDTAAQGLGVSIRNEAGYRAAAKQMVDLLSGLGAVDTQARDLAAASGLILSDAPTQAP